MATALDTLFGQSYGAKQYSMLGIHMQRAMLILVIVSIPLAIIWINTTPILLFLGQDHDISMAAGDQILANSKHRIPNDDICSGITTLLHILICWVVVFKSELGLRGPALGNSISNWFNVMLLLLYVKLSPSCAKTWTGFSKEVFHNIFTFLRLAVPSAIMVCKVRHPYSISTFSHFTYHFLNELDILYSTRISNELGAGNPEAARLAVNVVIVVAICVGLSVGSILILIRNIWGHAYSNEVEVVKYVAVMMPLVATSNFLRLPPKIGAYINLGSYYIVGIPCAVLLAFVLNVGGKGLWLGLICALAAQATGLSTVTIRTNWEKE
ncbi:hypothetical protein Gohar_011948, partial [Gossypium harknessii]|nr:hypothetical protein [Gossypium harknessii]